jgi:cysteinyl-tRNA synthetase
VGAARSPNSLPFAQVPLVRYSPLVLKIFNTLTDQLEPFEPLHPPAVNMYVCGPTVYADSHIGHGRAYVVYDAIYRYLKHRGFKVKYVRNITDIDDKIIARSHQEKISFSQVAEKYTDHFNRDLSDLGLLPPDAAPKATETVAEIIAMIVKLISSGHAYESAGDVYFSIVSFSSYGKLSKRDLKGMKAGARVEPGEQKRNPLDFALWKKAKPGEPSWTSPWGEGRPGWHIECSAMSKKFLAESIDIHAGGRDLIFPHHENEIAQSESASGKPFSKYWLHNGFVNINEEKMSKSLGNIVSLRNLLEQNHPEALKLYLLSHHYRSPVDFADVGIEESSRALDRMYRVLLSIPKGEGQEDPAICEKFEQAMDDDFNTAKAIALLFDAVKEANRFQQKSETLSKAQSLRKTIVQLANILGLLQHDPAEYFRSLPSMKHADVSSIEGLIAERAQARRKKDFARGDQIRKELAEKFKVIVEDAPEGTTWRLSS